MRLFQNSGVYASYLKYFDHEYGPHSTFKQRCNDYLNDRYSALHILKPVLQQDQTTFFTNGDDKILQQAWAKEKGMPEGQSLPDILLAQIEDHNSEFFYNQDPMRYGSEFVKRLPGCVRKTLCWRAAPSPGGDFSAYNTILCNFPAIIKSYQAQGWRSDYFLPGHDPVMDKYADNKNRPIDIIFVGGYSRHHQRRAEVLEAVATLQKEYKLRFHIDCSRLVMLSESLFGHFLPLRSHRRPSDIRSISAKPIFGLKLYEAISQAKIVLNGAIDMAGNERGNMRCFEAMGCGALMLSDEGNYPKGIRNGANMITYNSPEDATYQIKEILKDPDHLQSLAQQGAKTMKQIYSKDIQWQAFQDIIKTL